jgi:hypothetical protein
MGIGRITLGSSISVGLPLDEPYRALNQQRIEIDRSIANLPPGDPAHEDLWQSLQAVMEQLREAVSNLAASQAADLAGIQAKAAILAELLGADEDGAGPIIPDAERTALALSLTQDIARFTIG